MKPSEISKFIIKRFNTCFVLCIITGTEEERGINKWRRYEHSGDENEVDNSMRIYDLPWIQKYLDRVAFFRYLPFCPRFSLKRRSNVDEAEIQNNDYTNKSNTAQEFSVNNENTHL